MKKSLLTTALLMNISTSALAVKPADLLPAGQDSSLESGKHGQRDIRKGTILAFIRTLDFLNKELPKRESSTTILNEVKDLKNTIIDQETLGTFQFFPLSEWLGDNTKQGNILAGLYYLQLNPKELNETTRQMLQDIKRQHLHHAVIVEIDNIMN